MQSVALNRLLKVMLFSWLAISSFFTFFFQLLAKIAELSTAKINLKKKKNTSHYILFFFFFYLLYSLLVESSSKSTWIWAQQLTLRILMPCLLCEKLTVASLIKLSGTIWKSCIYYIKRNSMKKWIPYDEWALDTNYCGAINHYNHS